MTDREKVVKGLECCMINPDMCDRTNCPYAGKSDESDYCDTKLIKDALALLKAQEPRVMTLEEVKSCENPVWLEWNYYFMKPALLHSEEIMTDDNRKAVTFLLFGDEEWYIYADDDYGKEIRCWTSRPDEKRRAETPWES